MKLYLIEQRLIKIESELSEIKHIVLIMNQNLEKLSETIDNNLSKECRKMGEHIDFVESIYENVKHPLNFICKKVNHLSGEEKSTIKNSHHLVYKK